MPIASLQPEGINIKRSKLHIRFLVSFPISGFEDNLRPILSPTRESMMGKMKFVRSPTMSARSR